MNWGDWKASDIYQISTEGLLLSPTTYAAICQIVGEMYAAA